MLSSDSPKRFFLCLQALWVPQWNCRLSDLGTVTQHSTTLERSLYIRRKRSDRCAWGLQWAPNTKEIAHSVGFLRAATAVGKSSSIESLAETQKRCRIWTWQQHISLRSDSVRLLNFRNFQDNLMHFVDCAGTSSNGVPWDDHQSKAILPQIMIIITNNNSDNDNRAILPRMESSKKWKLRYSQFVTGPESWSTCFFSSESSVHPNTMPGIATHAKARFVAECLYKIESWMLMMHTLYCVVA